MTKQEKMPGKKGMSGAGRVSYPNLFRPRTSTIAGKEVTNFSVTLIFDPSVPAEKKALDDLKKVATEVEKEAWKRRPNGFKDPIKYGDPEDPDCKEEYRGKYYVQFKANPDKHRPQVVDQNVEEIDPMDADGLYAGCYGRVSYYCTAYTMGNIGVTFVLNNFQKTGDGEKLATGRTSAADDFDAVEDYRTAGADNF